MRVVDTTSTFFSLLKDHAELEEKALTYWVSERIKEKVEDWLARQETVLLDHNY